VDDSKPSKSARKRQFAELQELGELLVGLTDAKLVEIVAEPRLVEAVRHARSINAHGALRRQKQLIGKIMRDIDADPIRRAIDALDQRSQQDSRVFRDAERWRDRLCAEGAAAIVEFRALTGKDCEALAKRLQEHAAASRQTVRKTAYRQIFREIHKELLAKMQN
jgi:ribosome-associated protein